ncbi:IS3 family transposase [uncultured Slackia sp.]|uniref:IS3 family transposase n=1 Tax=uncultured Slackia sp. TaxID=665903 RepID=UPI002614A318|nr:IS3 family transposase [uncultured Slackia sp.]
MIVFKNVTAGYGENIIFKDFSLKIENSTAFMGASGLGKTTFLKLVMGLIEPFCGEVEVSGRVSAVFQEDRLTPYTVLSNLTLIGAERPAIAGICEKSRFRYGYRRVADTLRKAAGIRIADKTALKAVREEGLLLRARRRRRRRFRMGRAGSTGCARL